LKSINKEENIAKGKNTDKHTTLTLTSSIQMSIALLHWISNFGLVRSCRIFPTTHV